jgi:hypothetical protein
MELVPTVRIHLAPPTSLNCREFSQPAAAKYAKLAHFWRYLLNNMDGENGLLGVEWASLSRLFFGDAMSSPTFKLLGRRTTSDHKPNGSRSRT